MSDDRLANFGRLRQSVDQVESVFYFAVQLGVACAFQDASSIYRQGLVDWQACAKLIGLTTLGVLDQIVRVFQIFQCAETAKIIIALEWEPQRVHLLVAPPAVAVTCSVLHPLAKRLVGVWWNHRVDGDGYVGNGSCQKLFTNPLAPVDRVGL